MTTEHEHPMVLGFGQFAGSDEGEDGWEEENWEEISRREFETEAMIDDRAYNNATTYVADKGGTA